VNSDAELAVAGRDGAVLLERPLPPWTSRAILEQGYYHLGGPVARTIDVDEERTPAQRVALWRLDYPGSPFESAPSELDILRFPQHPLMALRTPATDASPRPWPTYATGFLAGAVIAPVWSLERTRVPAGAELRRVDSAGNEHVLAVFNGPALGWNGGRGYYPPVHLVGTRAKWAALDVPGELLGNDVELVVVGSTAPPGFAEVRADVWRRLVPRAEVSDVFELVLSCRYRGIPSRILQHTADQSRLLLLDDDPLVAEQFGAEEVDLGTFEVTVDSAALEDVGGATRSLAPAS
jgi:hypothetical protein